MKVTFKQIEHVIGTNPAEALANAIILNASIDYMNAKETISKLEAEKKQHGGKLTYRDATRLMSAYTMVKECLEFFDSKFYSVLTRLDPELLVEKLNKEVKKHGKN